MTNELHIVCPHCNAINRIPKTSLKRNPKCGKCHKALFTGKPIALDSSNFNLHIKKNDIPVIVSFWAAWNEDSKIMSPVYALATTRLEPHVRLAKVNRDTEQEISKKYAILEVPTLVLFKGGEEADRDYGAFDIARLLKWVKSHL